MDRIPLQELKMRINSAELSGSETYSDEELDRIYNRRDRVEPREGYECAICGNHEIVFVHHNGERYSKYCTCRAKRNSLKHLREAGLLELYERYTFDAFQIPQVWQQTAKQVVQRFVDDEKRGWLLLSGQSGCGKTHLCTAAVGALIERGFGARVMRWVEESARLKAFANDAIEYEKRLEAFKCAPVLFIDDLFKLQQGKDPSAADVRLAFDLIDYRYCNRKLITIISTERTVDEIKGIDEAIGGRIYEMSKGYCVEFGSGNKNQRFAEHQ